MPRRQRPTRPDANWTTRVAKERTLRAPRAELPRSRWIRPDWTRLQAVPASSPRSPHPPPGLVAAHRDPAALARAGCGRQDRRFVGASGAFIAPRCRWTRLLRARRRRHRAPGRGDRKIGHARRSAARRRLRGLRPARGLRHPRRLHRGGDRRQLRVAGRNRAGLIRAGLTRGGRRAGAGARLLPGCHALGDLGGDLRAGAP